MYESRVCEAFWGGGRRLMTWFRPVRVVEHQFVMTRQGLRVVACVSWLTWSERVRAWLEIRARRIMEVAYRTRQLWE